MTTNNTLTLSLLLALSAIGPAAAEDIRLSDGTTCTVVEARPGQNDSGSMSTSVTAGNGSVSSTTTMPSAPQASQSTAGASASGGSVDSFSTASVTQPDGSVVTKRSDGTCAVTKPQR